ncbi:MAG: hypothetical protein AAF170_04035 [Bacteroidota bacterium]
MRIVLLALALSSSAYAQPERSLNYERELLGLGGVASGVILSLSLNSALDNARVFSGWVRTGSVVIAYPVGVSLGVHGAGLLLGVDGTYRRALGGALLGAPIGYAAGFATVFVLVPVAEAAGITGFDALGVGLLGGAIVAATIPAAFSARNYHVAPVQLHQPDGSANGLAIQFSF